MTNRGLNRDDVGSPVVYHGPAVDEYQRVPRMSDPENVVFEEDQR